MLQKRKGTLKIKGQQLRAEHQYHQLVSTSTHSPKHTPWGKGETASYQCKLDTGLEMKLLDCFLRRNTQRARSQRKGRLMSGSQVWCAEAGVQAVTAAGEGRGERTL